MNCTNFQKKSRSDSFGQSSYPIGDCGFTLLELLVVIAIIAILASLLFPTLSKAKARGQQVACLNNVRQLQIGWSLYTDEHQGSIPENKAQGAGQLTALSMTNSWIMGNAQASANLINIQGGVLYPYTANPGIYLCPADRTRVFGTSTRRIRSYSMNCYLNGIRTDIVTKYNSLLPGPSGIFVFLDEQEESIDDGYFLVERANADFWPNLAADRHMQGANLSFADGHCERWKWLTSKKFTYWFQVVSGPDDVRDLRRLQAAVPNAP